MGRSSSIDKVLRALDDVDDYLEEKTLECRKNKLNKKFSKDSKRKIKKPKMGSECIINTLGRDIKKSLRSLGKHM